MESHILVVISSVEKLFQNQFFHILKFCLSFRWKLYVYKLAWMLQQHSIYCFGYKISVFKNKTKGNLLKTRRWAQNQCRNWYELSGSAPGVSSAGFSCCWEKVRPGWGISFLWWAKFHCTQTPPCAMLLLIWLETLNWQLIWCVFLAWGFHKTIAI